MGSSPQLWSTACKSATLAHGLLVSIVPALFCGFCMQNSDFWTSIQVSMGNRPYLSFIFMQNSDFRTRLTSLDGSQTSSVVLSTHNCVISTIINSLYGFQPSRVVLCMQISDFSAWITSHYWSQLSSEVFACKTATFGPEKQVSMSIRPHPSFCTCKSSWLAPE